MRHWADDDTIRAISVMGRRRREALADYLQEASTMPTPASPAATAPPDGWYAPAAAAPASGRSPWIHIAAISVGCVDEAIILGFRWKPDLPATTRYLLPMTTMEADPVSGSDALITRLDLFLDSGSWRDYAYPIDGFTKVIVMPHLPGQHGKVRR